MRRNRGASTQSPESIWNDVGVGVPQIIAGEINVLPPDGGKVSNAGAARSRRNLRQVSRRLLLIRHADAQDYR
jgi:hypothetical protein